MNDTPRPEFGTMVEGLAWDVGLPVVAYYALHQLGANDWVALLVASGLAALRVAWGIVATRTLNAFAAVMLIVFGLGLALSFVAGDPRFLLLKGSFVTGAVGLTFLVTGLRGRRPLTLAAQQSWRPAHAEELAAEYRDDPDVRKAHRIASLVWGIGLLTEAIVRIPLIYLLPVEIMVGLSTGLLVVAFAVLILWTARYMAKYQGRDAATSEPPQ